MRLFRFLFVMMAPLLFFACAKEKSFEQGKETTAQWEFQEGSNQFKGGVDTAYVLEFGGNNKAFLFQGTSDDGTGLLSIAISGISITSPGVYRTPEVQFDYVKSTGIVYENDLTAADQFIVEITQVDSNSITGVFSGKVLDASGGEKTITNGKFSARIVVPPAGQTGSGDVIFWAKNSCTAGGPITVRVTNSQTNSTLSFNSFTSTAPDCSTPNIPKFTLPAGSYVWVAKCGPTDSIAGVITVSANQCIQTELVFGPPAATGQATFWSKNSCTAGGNISVRLSNSQTGTITAFTASAPGSCATSGNANFVLPAGNYTWVAKCGPTDSVSGNLSVTANVCSKVEVVFATGPGAQYTLSGNGGNCTSAQVKGTYIATKLLGDTNNVVVQVNVTAIGSYSIATNTVNGYSFSATGSFATTGVQNVTLKSVGTPLASGTNNFTVNGGVSSCGFSVPVVNAVVSPTLNTWSFTQGSRTFSGTFPDGGEFGNDYNGVGKALFMFVEIPNTDTIFGIYIQFPAAATQPVVNSYVTNPDLSSTTNSTDFYMGDDNNDIFFVKDVPPLPATTPTLTITITSYDPTTKIVKGTFTGTAWNTAMAIVPITNGKFEALVKF